MTDRQSTDLTVIGAGPAGLYAAYDAGFGGPSVTLVDNAAVSVDPDVRVSPGPSSG